MDTLNPTPPADDQAGELQELRDQVAAAEERAAAAERAAEKAAAAADADGAEPTRYAAWDKVYERFVEGTVRATKAASTKAAKSAGYESGAVEIREV